MLRKLKCGDLTGKKFGKLTVISFKSGKSEWYCKCDCGNETVARTPNLIKGRHASCGCNVRENISKAKKEIGTDIYLKRAFNAYKVGAIRRSYTFELTLDQFLSITSKNCQYCGIEPQETNLIKWWKEKRNSLDEFKLNGIDRVDNSKGYVESNCVPCCKIYNMAKLTLTLDEWHTWIQRIIKHNIKE
jgi:hypothetical protein